jgi:hypothetical protein
MENAAKMKEHHADGTISVQVLKGRCSIRTRSHPASLIPPLEILILLAKTTRNRQQ